MALLTIARRHQPQPGYQTVNQGETEMKRTIVLLAIVITILAALAPVASATYWGYQQERSVKQNARQFVKELQSQGIDAQFKFYEDGSWHIVGCVSDGLCQD
jgi:type II secretory pathway pseudopilin PulG